MRILKKGEQPTLGLFSGTHGDEWQIIASVEKMVNTHLTELPNFLYLPETSPSAVSQKSRLNSEGIDLNRGFTKEPTSREVLDIMTILRPHHFKLCVDFHEDVEDPGVYLYDTQDIEGSQVLANFREQVSQIAPLYSGLDDERDPSLGGHIYKGYRSMNPPKKDYQGNYIYEGFLDYWALIERKTERWMTLELPTSLTPAQKDQLVEIFFQTFILK